MKNPSEKRERKNSKKRRRRKKPEIGDDYLEDYRVRRNDKKMPERDRSAKRKPVAELGRPGTDYGPGTKRRRRGEVGLSNVLEHIVETLWENTEVSFLFLNQCPRKRLQITRIPMDLSTIRDKMRRMEYKDSEDFRHDVWQIAYNAHMYNDERNPGIPSLADQLLELCDYLLDGNLSEAEAGIQNRNPR